jgi:hypothetical protein
MKFEQCVMFLHVCVPSFSLKVFKIQINNLFRIEKPFD